MKIHRNPWLSVRTQRTLLTYIYQYGNLYLITTLLDAGYNNLEILKTVDMQCFITLFNLVAWLYTPCATLKIIDSSKGYV